MEKKNNLGLDVVKTIDFHNNYNQQGCSSSQKTDNKNRNFINYTDSKNPPYNSKFNPSEDIKVEKKYSTNKCLNIFPADNCPDLFYNHKEINIDEFGLKDSSNSKSNRYTFFGVDETNDGNSNPNQVAVNLAQDPNKLDLLSQSGKKSISSLANFKKKKFPLFYIFYDTNIKKYLIKSFSNEVLFSYVIQNNFQLELDYAKKNFFKLGKVIVIIQLSKATETISIKVKKGISVSKEFQKNFSYEELPISIGRENCNVIIPCKTVSKTHVSICRDMNNRTKLFLVDNFSTNGSQLLLQEGKIIILENEVMTFNIGTKQFVIRQKTER